MNEKIIVLVSAIQNKLYSKKCLTHQLLTICNLEFWNAYRVREASEKQKRVLIN